MKLQIESLGSRVQCFWLSVSVSGFSFSYLGLESLTIGLIIGRGKEVVALTSPLKSKLSEKHRGHQIITVYVLGAMVRPPSLACNI